jgi:3-oxoacyl-[acyl-carrier-protein] synthase II
MREVWIADARAITPLGDTRQDLWACLLQGKSSIRPVGRFPVGNYMSTIGSWFDKLPLETESSACQLLIEGLISDLEDIPRDSLLITATTKSGIDNLEKLSRGKNAAREDVFLFSIAASASKKLGLGGGWFNVSAACASSTVALSRGADFIASGFTDTVIVLCVDLLTEFVFAGFSALRILSPSPCRPFDRNRDGLSLGEGAAAVILMSPERCRRLDLRPMGRIAGWGCTNDANHLTSPSAEGNGLIRAIADALRRARLESGDIAAIGAHGTATVYNDLMELRAFDRILAGRRIPVYSIKGAIGHTLGAAGGIETVVGLLALDANTAPPTVGFALPESGAEGKVSGAPAAIQGDYILITNSGFGGINAALILGRG